ncbi:MAG: hypothetical protein REI78_08365 [Pedobacter sp.]|nr:hypothetical protein [Pedobacter sp.]MDQ8053027.1 hypothetical protein [Pedobacter sp.]
MNRIKMLLSTLMLLMTTLAYSQKKRIDFLVDTVNIPKASRINSISGKGEIIYTFFCRCLETKQDMRFTYLNSKKGSISLMRPKFHFFAWKDLLDLIDNDVIKFDQNYELYITEVLPQNRYITNKVYFDYHRGKSY